MTIKKRYYHFLLEGRTEANGVSILDAEHIIPLKMKAWLDLKEKKRKPRECTWTLMILRNIVWIYSTCSNSFEKTKKYLCRSLSHWMSILLLSRCEKRKCV